MTESKGFTFYPVQEFLSKVGNAGEQADVVQNPNPDPETGNHKKFVTIGDKTFRCQQTIDLNKRLVFMHKSDEDISKACLINPKGGNNVQGTLGTA